MSYVHTIDNICLSSHEQYGRQFWQLTVHIWLSVSEAELLLNSEELSMYILYVDMYHFHFYGTSESLSPLGQIVPERTLWAVIKRNCNVTCSSARSTPKKKSTCANIQVNVIQGSGFRPVTYLVTTADLRPVHRGNQVVKFVDDTYMYVCNTFRLVYCMYDDPTLSPNR